MPHLLRSLATAVALVSFASLADAQSPAAPQPAVRYHGVYRELPVSSITPTDWLAEFLRRQRDGLALHRRASGYPFDTDLWEGRLENGKWPAYEQMAYFVDGIYRAGLLLRDKPLTDEAMKSIRYTLAHPAPNGLLGPGPNDMSLKVGPDGVAGPTVMGAHWPMAVFTRVLMAHYAETKDRAILDALAKHYGTLGESFGVDNRDVNAIEGMCWLAEQTGDARFVAQAERTWNNFVTSRSNHHPKKPIWTLPTMRDSQRLIGHGVSVSEISKQVMCLYIATGKREYLDAGVGGFKSLERDHQLVDGVLSSDASLSGKQPERQHETCVVPDYGWSLGYALMAGGDVRYADTIERGLFNAGLSSIDRDFRAHQYYSSPNQMIATHTSNNPNTGIKNRNLQAYRPIIAPECCTGNVQRMMPNHVARMWLADNAGGLVAAMYGPSKVKAPVGASGTIVEITQRTGYPFDGRIELTIAAEKPVEFPLSLRIPAWADGATVSVAGVEEDVKAGTFHTIRRTFKTGDVVTIDLPMRVRLEQPVPTGQSLVRGPLLFTVNIKEERTAVPDAKLPDPANFPGWDYRPLSPWNYSLALTGDADLAKVKVRQNAPSSADAYPWTAATSPVTLSAPARVVEGWTLTAKGENAPLPKPPIQVSGDELMIDMVPQGATHLHVTVFPDAAASGDAP